MKRNRQSGQSLAEYGLILALTSLAGIAGLTFMGDSISNGIQQVSDLLTGNATATTTPGTPPPGYTPTLIAPPTNGIAGVIPAPMAGEEQVCFQSGFCLNVAVQDGSLDVETAGAMGGAVMQKAVSVLDQIVAQLEADPNTDPTLLAKMQALAAKGHNAADQMQDEEASIAQNAQSYGCANYTTAFCSFDSGTQSFIKSNTDYFGSIDSIGNYHFISGGNNHGATTITTSSFTSEWNSLKSYLNTNPNALPPEMKAVLTTQANQISDLGAKGSYTLQVDPATGDYMFKVNQSGVVMEQSADRICGLTGSTSGCQYTGTG